MFFFMLDLEIDFLFDVMLKFLSIFKEHLKIQLVLTDWRFQRF